ncbi:MAG TPA: relaxase/mobilization nuclease domain-containing protein [Ohtaekwangia sp.]|nr:relaxase/mobilization nuclease domain-containing protein [Ohtaekwangia sp.]
MVCKVRSGKNIKGAINYNENKVKEGVAECIGAANFVGEPQNLRFFDKLARFDQLIEKNARAKTNCVHISLNFDVSEKLSQNKLNVIAADYMDKIGFGDQPYLVYQHNDAAHPHLHIVTTNIHEDGKRISIHNLGKNQSETARKEIEDKYGLVKAGSTHKQEIHTNLNRAVYGKTETKRTIDNIVGEVMKRYKFSSLTEFNAVLRQYNVMADRGKEGMLMYKKNGLRFSLLNAKGDKVGVPIKASALYSKPTMKTLQNVFETNSLPKEFDKERLTKIIDSFFNATDKHTRANFCGYMKLYEINAMFREGKDGRVYGLTLVDNRKCIVFNGSDLGKGYSGQALMKRFELQPKLVKEKGMCLLLKVQNCNNFNSAIFLYRPGYMTLQKNY